jgi:hypothetical protein
MSKEKPITLNLPLITALDLIDVLENATKGYSEEFPPDRITRLRNVLRTLDEDIVAKAKGSR